ncbi:tRNA dimethylallyltransferase [bacterium BMS3Abin04]|nr:tRNA dimethylallyltransferase [bacterium BMS3Abin04]
MLEDGLIKEVKDILNQNYSKNLNSLNTVGYKEIISFLNHEISFEEAVRLIKRNSRHYAKRQLTWFRKDERIVWFDLDSANQLEDIAEEITQNIKE